MQKQQHDIDVMYRPLAVLLSKLAIEKPISVIAMLATVPTLNLQYVSPLISQWDFVYSIIQSTNNKIKSYE